VFANVKYLVNFSARASLAGLTVRGSDGFISTLYSSPKMSIYTM